MPPPVSPIPPPSSAPSTYADRIAQPTADAGFKATRASPLPAPIQPGWTEGASDWQKRYPDGTLAPEQFGAEGEATGVAAAICGPVAAVAFARATGRQPTIAEALAIAKQNGRWKGEMQGPASEQQLLSDLGVASRLDETPTSDEVIADVQNGNPVIVSSTGHYHYFVITGYDPRTGLYDTGNTGLALKNGSRWRSWDDLSAQATLFIDEPTSPVPSVAARQPTTTSGAVAQATESPRGIDRGGTLDPTAAPETTWQLADRKSAEWGLSDPLVLRALILAESGGNPSEIGDSGQSYGLLQAYTGPGGGRGSGHDPSRLLDPEYNLDIAKGEITAAYRQAEAEGLTGAALARRVGELAQRPDPAYYHRYADAYATLQGGGMPTTTPGGLPTGRTGNAGPFAPAERPYAPTYDSPERQPEPDPWAGVRDTLGRVREGVEGLGQGASDFLSRGSLTPEQADAYDRRHADTAMDDGWTAGGPAQRDLTPRPESLTALGNAPTIPGSPEWLGGNAMEGLDRPNRAVRSAVDVRMQGGDYGRALEAAGQGFRGERDASYQEMIERANPALGQKIPDATVWQLLGGTPQGMILAAAIQAAGGISYSQAAGAAATVTADPLNALEILGLAGRGVRLTGGAGVDAIRALGRAAGEVGDIGEGMRAPTAGPIGRVVGRGLEVIGQGGLRGGAEDAPAAAQGAREVARSPQARDLIRAYAEVTPARIERLKERALRIATGAIAPGGGEAYQATRALLEDAWRSGLARMPETSVVATNMDGPRLLALAREGWWSNKLTAFADRETIGARTAKNVGKTRLRPGEGVDFAIREGGADKMALGTTQLPDEFGVRDPDAINRVYAYKTNGAPMIGDMKQAVWLVMEDDAPRVATGHHHYGPGSPGAAIHTKNTPPGLKSYMWDADAVRGGRQVPGTFGLDLVGWEAAGIPTGGGRVMADTDQFVGNAGEDAQRMANLILGNTNQIKGWVKRGIVQSGDDLAAALMRESTSHVQPIKDAAAAVTGKRVAPPQVLADLRKKAAQLARKGKSLSAEDQEVLDTGQGYFLTREEHAANQTGYSVNRARMEALLIDPNLGDVKAIYLAGRPVDLAATVANAGKRTAEHMAADARLPESLRRVMPRGGTATVLDLAREVRARAMREFGKDIPILFNDLTPTLENGRLVPPQRLISGAQVLEGPPTTLAPGRGALRDAYTALTDTAGKRAFTDIGSVPVNAALLGGATAGLGGALYGASRTPQGQSLLERGREALGRGLQAAGSAIGAASDAAREGRDAARDLLQADWDHPLDDPAAEQIARRDAVLAARQLAHGREPTPAEIEAQLPWARSALMAGYGAMGMAAGGGGAGAAAPSALRKADAQYRAFTSSNLLSGIPGIVRNVGGGPAMLASEVGTAALSPLNEAALRLLRPSAPRTRFLSEVGPALRGAAEGVVPGAKGALEAALGKVTTPSGSSSLSREMIGGRWNPLNWPLRAYAANDAFAGSVGYRLGDRRAAERIASQRGIRGPYRAATVELLADLGRRERLPATDPNGPNSIPPMLKAAAREVRRYGDEVADRLTVRDGFGELDKALNTLNRIYFLGPLLVPFSKGVNAAIKSGYQHSPVAAPELALKLIRDLKTPPPGGYGPLADRLARLEMGVGAMAGAAVLYNSGFMTGARPTDPKLAKLWDDQGNVEYSFNLGGGMHLPFQMLTPIGPNLMATADALDAAREGKDATHVAAAAANGWMNGMGNLPFVQGWADVVGLFDASRFLKDDPERFAGAVERVARQRVGGLLPASGFFRQVERTPGVDPYRRAPEGIGQTAQATYPVIGGGTLEPPPGEDAPWGAPIRGAIRSTPAGDLLAPRILPKLEAGSDRPVRTGGNALNAVNPFRTASTADDPSGMLAESARIGRGFTEASDALGGQSLTGDQQYDYQKVLGQAQGEQRAALYATPEYKRADEATQADWTKQADARAARRARVVYAGRAGIDLTPDRPDRYDPRVIGMLGRWLPNEQIAAYQANPALLELDVADAMAALRDYQQSRRKTPRPTREQMVLAELASSTYWSREYAAWSRDPARRAAEAEEDSFIRTLEPAAP